MAKFYPVYNKFKLLNRNKMAQLHAIPKNSKPVRAPKASVETYRFKTAAVFSRGKARWVFSCPALRFSLWGKIARVAQGCFATRQRLSSRCYQSLEPLRTHVQLVGAAALPAALGALLPRA